MEYYYISILLHGTWWKCFDTTKTQIWNHFSSTASIYFNTYTV